MDAYKISPSTTVTNSNNHHCALPVYRHDPNKIKFFSLLSPFILINYYITRWYVPQPVFRIRKNTHTHTTHQQSQVHAHTRPFAHPLEHTCVNVILKRYHSINKTTLLNVYMLLSPPPPPPPPLLQQYTLYGTATLRPSNWSIIFLTDWILLFRFLCVDSFSFASSHLPHPQNVVAFIFPIIIVQYWMLYALVCR